MKTGIDIAVKPRCPDCGRGGVRQRADAWQARRLDGFDQDGEPILEDDPDYEVFDDIHFECDHCGYKSSEAWDFYNEPTSYSRRPRDASNSKRATTRMNLMCDTSVAAGYKSSSQIARVVSEGWLASNGYCLACEANSLTRSIANTRCTDFVCSNCNHRYELKTFRKRPAKSLPDGAYSALIGRVNDGTAPTLFLLQREEHWGIRAFSAIHSTFLTPSVIEERKPLSPKADRAGWIGCNIRIDLIGPDGEVRIIERGQITPRGQVRAQFRRFIPLAYIPPAERGWTTLTLSVVRSLSKRQFALTDLYEREYVFSSSYPGNVNIRAKIRQQLQVLRDLGLIQFDGRGEYTLIG